MAVPIRPEELLKDLLCPVCLELPQAPYVSKPCSHVFCKDCFRNSLNRLPDKCPMCRCHCTREDLVPMKTGNPLSYRIWANIAVKCGQHSEGCGWVGSLSDYKSHTQSCLQEKKIKSIRSLKEENEKLIIDNEHMIEDCEEFNVKIESLFATNEKLENTIWKLKRGTQDLKSTIRKQEKKMKYFRSLKEENDELIIENEHINDVCGELNVKIEALSTTTEKLKSTVRKLKRGRQDLESTMRKIPRRDLLEMVAKVFQEATPDQGDLIAL